MCRAAPRASWLNGWDACKHRGTPSRRRRSGGVQIHSVRLPGYYVSTEVIFGQPEERLHFLHEAGSGAGPTLCLRQVFGKPDDGMQELVQAGEGKLGLRFGARRREDADACAPHVLSSTLQQR
jgi:hypothetical protein